jgi:hypothetical protein
MTQFVTVWDDILKRHVDIPIPITSEGSGDTIPVVWQDVSSNIMFGFNGLRHWPDLGVGGKFEALACITDKRIDLSLFGQIGAGASFPSESAWFFYMLDPRLQTNRRWIGSAFFYNQGVGSLHGVCRFLNKDDATPPYWPLCLYHAPSLPPGPGYVTTIYPWKWKERVGSWFTASITYGTV